MIRYYTKPSVHETELWFEKSSVSTLLMAAFLAFLIPAASFATDDPAAGYRADRDALVACLTDHGQADRAQAVREAPAPRSPFGLARAAAHFVSERLRVCPPEVVTLPTREQGAGSQPPPPQPPPTPEPAPPPDEPTPPSAPATPPPQPLPSAPLAPLGTDDPDEIDDLAAQLPAIGTPPGSMSGPGGISAVPVVQPPPTLAGFLDQIPPGFVGATTARAITNGVQLNLSGERCEILSVEVQGQLVVPTHGTMPVVGQLPDGRLVPGVPFGRTVRFFVPLPPPGVSSHEVDVVCYVLDGATYPGGAMQRAATPQGLVILAPHGPVVEHRRGHLILHHGGGGPAVITRSHLGSI